MEKISCEKARALFDPKIDNEISKQEQELLEKHLDSCESCRREYAELLAIHKAMRELAVEIPPQLHEHVMASIKKEPKHRTPLLRWIRPLAAVSVAAVLCVAVIHSPILDMFRANSKMDNSLEAPEENDLHYSTDIKDEIDGNINAGEDITVAGEGIVVSPSKVEDKEDDSKSEATPSIVQRYAIADTDLSLCMTAETTTVLELNNDDAETV